MVKDLQPQMSYLEYRSVLGPLLFLVYINDAEHQPLSIGSIMNLFADVTLLHQIITSSLDYIKLQSDIDTFACYMLYKCKYMMISKCKFRAVPC